MARKYKLLVQDTITFERTCVVEVEAATLEAAQDVARGWANDGALHEHWNEEEIENTPYDVSSVTDDDVIAYGDHPVTAEDLKNGNEPRR